jgi:hypothetical protein
LLYHLLLPPRHTTSSIDISVHNTDILHLKQHWHLAPLISVFRTLASEPVPRHTARLPAGPLGPALGPSLASLGALPDNGSVERDVPSLTRKYVEDGSAFEPPPRQQTPGDQTMNSEGVLTQKYYLIPQLIRPKNRGNLRNKTKQHWDDDKVLLFRSIVINKSIRLWCGPRYKQEKSKRDE